jgi:hypothetical protein
MTTTSYVANATWRVAVALQPLADHAPRRRFAIQCKAQRPAFGADPAEPHFDRPRAEWITGRIEPISTEVIARRTQQNIPVGQRPNLDRIAASPVMDDPNPTSSAANSTKSPLFDRAMSHYRPPS